ncbi:MAG: response regulator transcription factor [Acidobacteria bacterium]|nr:response regulator transcription factor [Acidobacteriota bacterium]
MLRTIYLVEDDLDIASLVQFNLEKNGFEVRVFSGVAGVLPAAEKSQPDLFILDIMLPDGDGLDLSRDIRGSPGLVAIPIIFLTAKAEEMDRVLGLELGADDYVTKPFSPRELVARVKAVLRRLDQPALEALVSAGDLTIDPGAVKVMLRGQEIDLSATEYRLLEYLARRPGRAFSRDQLLQAVWQETRFVTPRSVDVYVRRIREKIEADPENPCYIVTVRGAGYRFEAPQ